MKICDIHLPTLQSLADKTQARINDLNKRMADETNGMRRKALRVQIVKAVREIKEIKDEISARLVMGEAPVPRVTEHAMIRFLDRELNYDLADLEALILTPDVRRLIEAGHTSIPLASGNVLKVRGKVVTTVMPGRVLE
jgi:hypothetical protein